MAKRMGKRNRAAVVVLGDLGRSPRMQYHALSLASQAGLEVDIIAYSGSEPNAALIHNSQIHLHLMNSPLPQGLPRILYLMALPLKLLIQTFTLVWILLVRVPAPDFFLVQNPPSIPTFTVVRWACWLRKAAFIIDWHNFGYTILGMSLGVSHPLVKMYSWYERRYGKMANGHLCVTKAMQHELEENWDIQATVLYDRAPGHFHSTSVEEKHELFCRLHYALGAYNNNPSGAAGERQKASENRKLQEGQGQQLTLESETKDLQESTLFTGCSLSSEGELNQARSADGRKVWLQENRPALIVSSTSWTADEDFGMLLEAAVCYDRRVSALLGEEDSLVGIVSEFEATRGPFPCLFIVVTGKGPMRKEYEKRIQKLRLRRVAFRTMWVTSNDYPLLLGSADLGVCLHTSSSGLDLPMKVVDMFGCGLPVCAVSYSCINELVKDGENGLLFWSSSQLANQFLELFKGFPHECNLLGKLRSGALASGSSSRWAEEWEKNVIPLITKLV